MVLLHEQRDVPVTTLMFSAKYGAAYENENEKGIAHFLEHLCFKGTRRRTAEQISSEIEKIGGVINAFTSEENINFHIKVPSEYLSLAADVLFDIFFESNFPESEIEKERQVILEEIKMYKDNPTIHTVYKIKEFLYEKPFGMMLGGSEKSVKLIKRQDIINKHKEFFIPNNSAFCVVGNNTFEEVLAVVEKLNIYEKRKLSKHYEVKLKNDSANEHRKGIEQANVAIGIHFPTASSKERYAAELFNAILGEGMSSKLFLEIREKRGLVYSVHSNLDNGDEYGYIFIHAGTDGKKAEEVVGLCKKVFMDMKNISQKELEDAKKQLIGMYKLSMEGSEETASNLLNEDGLKSADEYYNYPKRIEEVSLKDVQKLALIKEISVFILSP